MFTQIESVLSKQTPPIQLGYTVIMIYQINLSEPIHHSVRHAKEQIDMLAHRLRTGMSSNIWYN